MVCGVAADSYGMRPMPNATRRFRLVYVEDNPDDVYLLREALHAHGQPVDLQCFHDVTTALAALSAMERPDLVISDMNLPDRSGVDLVDHLARHSAAHIPVVLLSGVDGEYLSELASRRGMQVRCLTKGSNWQDYVTLAAQLVDLIRQRQSMA